MISRERLLFAAINKRIVQLLNCSIGNSKLVFVINEKQRDPTAHLNKSRQFFVQYKRSLFHVFDFALRRIFVLPIFDGVDVQIGELLFGTQK